ncbi:MAG TPA: hypothetical protein DDY77_04900 [Clostridiales bacterium]|nr:hypothetical protein [Clostridiales bacterium]
MKKLLAILAGVVATVTLLTFAGCSVEFNPDKNISIIARDRSSGTREAFDKVVTDGTQKLQYKDENGDTVYLTSSTAEEQDSTGVVKSKVQSDPQAIGYISFGSVDDTVKVVKVEGVAPSKATVLDGTYKIQRPFVIMTNKETKMTERAADFVKYLESSLVKEDCEKHGVIFLEDAKLRANEGEAAIPVGTYTKLEKLPDGEKIVIRGSTSMKEVIMEAAASYAKLYNVKADDLFDVELKGSSKGTKAVKEDTKGNTIGLSSAAVKDEKVRSFNICYDAVAVIVNKKNTLVENLTLKQLFEIYTAKITKFTEIK